MLVIENNMPALMDLEHSATSCFLAKSLVSPVGNSSIESKVLAVLSRLIDKTVSEYETSRSFIELEAKESGMTYEEILIRDSGQFLYTCPIINHLENCITTLARIYKILEDPHFQVKSNSLIHRIRNSIEHVEDRIISNPAETPVLSISSDSLALTIAGRRCGIERITTREIADEIRRLFSIIQKLL